MSLVVKFIKLNDKIIGPMKNDKFFSLVFISYIHYK